MGTHSFDYVLDDDFFAAVDGQGVKHGNVKACVTIKKANHNIEVSIEMDGTAETTCDRCLEPMNVNVEVDETIYVKFGDEYREEDTDLIIIPEESGIFDISWLLYEYTALSIPICHTHADGECNPEMIRILHQHQVGYASEKTVSDAGDIKDDNETDPRWAALKNILNN